MLAFHEPPDAVIAPVTQYGNTAGRAIFRHHSQPQTPKLVPQSRSSEGIAVAPAMTLNKMYHWVPRIISGLSQMSGLSFRTTIADTTTGNKRFAGKAARNWATG